MTENFNFSECPSAVLCRIGYWVFINPDGDPTCYKRMKNGSYLCLRDFKRCSLKPEMQPRLDLSDLEKNCH